jgi:hypothetical protein
MTSTSDSEFGQPNPSLTIPIRKSRACPVSRSGSSADWRESRPSVPASTSRSWAASRAVRNGPGMIECQFNREDARVWHKPVGWLVANSSAERAGNSDRSSLVAPDVALAGDDERRAAAGGASGRSLRIVRIERGPGVGGMAAAREALPRLTGSEAVRC